MAIMRLGLKAFMKGGCVVMEAINLREQNS
jgi:hypothetical protein